MLSLQLHKINKKNKKLQSSPSLCPVPGADIILGGSGGEGDPSGEVATLLVLVIALLRGNCSEPRTSSAPSEHRM